MKNSISDFGPWYCEYNPFVSMQTGEEIPCYRIFPDDLPEEYVCETNEHLPESQQEAYARLITASPDLYTALLYLFNVIHDYESSLRKGYVKRAIQQARKALASAKGGPV